MPYVSQLSVLLLSGSLVAQLAPGDIGMTGFSNTSFGVLTGGVNTSYVTGGYGGTGTSQAILWDPANPQDFLIGDFGFVGRATNTGPGTVSSTPASSPFPAASPSPKASF